MLEDIAVFTGGQVITEEAWFGSEIDRKLDQLGRARQVRVTKEEYDHRRRRRGCKRRLAPVLIKS